MATENDKYVMSPEEAAMRKKSWFAWVQSITGFASQIIASTTTAVYTIIAALAAAQFGCTTAELAIATSAFGLTYALFSFVWGNLADRIGLRWCISLASVWLGVWFIIVSMFSTSVMSFTVLLAIAGAGQGGLAAPTLSKSISGWFNTNWRGKGMILVNMGGNAASAIMGFMTGFLVEGGWTNAYMIMGIIYLVCAVVIFLMQRDSPESIGTVPFGSPKGTMPKPYIKPAAKTPEQKAAEKKQKNADMVFALKDPMTWKFGVLYIFWTLQQNSNKAFMVAAIVAAGVGDTKYGGALMGTFSFVMIFGQPIISFLGDYFTRKVIFGGAMFIQALVFVILWFMFGAGYTDMLPFMYGVLGFFTGTVGISWVMMAESFPPNMRGTGPGLVATFGVVGRVGGPIIAGLWITYLFGGYTPAYVLFAALMMALAGICAFAFLPKTSGKYGDTLAKKYYAEHPEEDPNNQKKVN